MASFTDEIPEFSPYVQQQPLEAMARVGMEREAQFQEGIKTVQSVYDSYLALPIAKQEIKNYVQEKVGQLHGAVKQSISGDFSDRRLLNQIGGLASQISNDPIVENGVQSTARIQAELARQKADQELNAKNGKNPVNNVNDFNDAVNAYLSDGQINTSFNGSYTPYVDVIDRAIKLFKEQAPGENIDRDAFFTDRDGKLQVNPTIKEGIDPKRIQAVLNLVYQQPDVQQQLLIDGKQTYKGLAPQQLAASLEASTNANLQNIERTISALQLQLVTDGTVDATAITSQINQLKEQATQLTEEFNRDANMLLANPDGVKASLIQRGITSNFVGAYAFEKMKKSPLWDATMETLRHELDLVRNGLEQEKFKYDKMDRDRKYELDVQREFRLSTGKKTDANGNPIPDGGDAHSITANVPESSGKLGSSTFDNLYQEGQTALNQGTMGVVFDVYNSKTTQPGDFNPIKLDPASGSYIYNIDPTGISGYRTRAEAEAKYQTTYTDARGTLALGKATPKVKEAFQQIQPQIQYMQALNVRKAELDKRKGVVLQNIKSQTGQAESDFVDAYIVENKLTDWQSSQARLRQKYGENWAVSMGIEYETSPYGEVNYYKKPKRITEYNQFKNKFSNTLASQFQDVENAYKESQLSLLPIKTVLTGPTPADKETARSIYSNVGSAIARGNKAYGDFRSLLEPDSKNEFKNNIYGAEYDPLEKKYYLTVQQGAEEPVKIEVDKSEFESVPQFKTDNAFWNKFGDLLSITNKTTTDVPVNGASGGFATSYLMQRPANSQYQVGYHVISNGKDLYDLKLYIKDKQGNDILQTTGGFSATPSALMNAIGQLENNDVYIDALIKRGKQ